MPTLADPKRENFAQLCARGLPTIDAYVRAGYKRNTGNATSLKKRPDVQARIEELQDSMASNNQSELNDYLKDEGLSPTYIVKKLLETGKDAHAAGKFDVAAKCFKDIGGELFGMFVERKHVSVDKQSVHTQATATLDLTSLNQALEVLGGTSPKVPQLEGNVRIIDVAGEVVSPAIVEREQP